MPALLFMGRRWGVAGDEFALPSLCSMALRVVWSVALVVILAGVGRDLRNCTDGWLVYTYMLITLTTFTLSVVVEWGITRVSTRGSIADTESRANLSAYLSVHMLLGGVQMVMAGLGVALIAYYDDTCHGLFSDEALNILLWVVVASQVVDVCVTLCCFMLMRGPPHEAVPESDNVDDETQSLYERFASTEIEGRWESRCYWLYRAMVFLTCGLFGGQGSTQADFEQLARVMARIFHTEEYLDVVPSDIAAGIVLLYHKQHERAIESGGSSLVASPQGRGSREADDAEEVEMGCMLDQEQPSLNPPRFLDYLQGVAGEGRRERVPASLLSRSQDHPKFYRVAGRRLLDVRNPSDRQALEEIAHFSRYSLAIYTWYLYLFDRPCCGACDLLCYICARRPKAFHKARDASASSLHASRETSARTDASQLTAATASISESARRGVSNGAGEARGGHLDGSLGVDASHGSGRSHQSVAEEGGFSRQAAGMGPRRRSLRSVDDVHVNVRGDNWLGTHEAALLRVAGLHPSCEVVDAQFEDGREPTPYCIMVDHDWQCVVISIRGTMSLEDCLSDLRAEPASLVETGQRWGFDGNGMYAHKGVLDRAEWLREDLDREGHLRALLGPGLGPSPDQVMSDHSGEGSGGIAGGHSRRGSGYSAARGRDGSAPGPFLSSRHLRCRGYDLRVTGHSLGGGTAVLLTYMLRRDYPSVRCIAISPMGGLLNSPHAERCGEFVLSAVMGDDVVPRLSVAAMERMRDEVLELIARAKVNKMTVMRSLVKGFRTSLSWSKRDTIRTRPLDHPSCQGSIRSLVYGQEEEVPRTDFYSQLRRYRAWVDKQREESSGPELLPAGKFVHFVKTADLALCCGSRRLFTPVWAAPSDFTDIAVSQRMFVDHFPTTSCPRFRETLKDLLREAREAEEEEAVRGARSEGAHDRL